SSSRSRAPGGPRAGLPEARTGCSPRLGQVTDSLNHQVLILRSRSGGAVPVHVVRVPETPPPFSVVRGPVRRAAPRAGPFGRNRTTRPSRGDRHATRDRPHRKAKDPPFPTLHDESQESDYFAPCRTVGRPTPRRLASAGLPSKRTGPTSRGTSVAVECADHRRDARRSPPAPRPVPPVGGRSRPAASPDRPAATGRRRPERTPASPVRAATRRAPALTAEARAALD